MWIKICGCRRPEDAAAAAASGADAFGLVLAPGFRRSLTVQEAALLAVGIFVAQPVAEVAATAAAVGLDGLQLHGAGAEAVAHLLRGRYRILRAWDMQEPEPAGGDWLHLEPGARQGGGTGRAWDWSGLALRRPRRPFVLAGGLTPETAAGACAAAEPDGVDVSSGVETDGRKDPEKIARFCQAVRRWQHARAAADLA